MDVREDRVVVFGRVSSEVREFVYRIRATNEGDFQAPPTFGEGMYDRSVQALSTGTKFTVKGNNP